MDETKLNKLNIKESIDFLNAFRGVNNIDILGSGGNDGRLYNVTSSGAGGAFYSAFIWLNSQTINKWQRSLGKFLYITNSIATVAVDNLAILTLGSGLQYQTPNEAKQKQIDEWVKINKWRRKEIQLFKEFIAQGEIFVRIFGNQVRTVDPDMVYNSASQPNSRLGIVHEPDDIETVTGYVVHRNPNSGDKGEFVPISEMQHRKNALFNCPRGFSRLLNCASDLFNIDKLTNNVMSSSELLAKIAFFRHHKAPEDSVREFRSGILDQQETADNTHLPRENIEHYPPQSIIDLPEGVEPVFPTAMDGNAYVEILNAGLRKIASTFTIPAAIFTEKDMAAYNASMVTSSFIVRQIEALQEDWKEYNLELLELSGINTDDVQVICPEVAIQDTTAQTQVADFLLKNKIASRETTGKMFGIDYEEEQELIASEPELEMPNDNTQNIDKKDI